jgi:photosystem II stability/assembly factor-like uncharacterized protein
MYRPVSPHKSRISVVIALALVLCAGAAGLAAPPAHAFVATDNGAWFWQAQAPQGFPVTDIACVDTTDWWATTGDGAIIRTADGGQSWTLQRPEGPGESFAAICMISKYEGWVVGSALNPATATYQAAVLHTRDGGITWDDTVFTGVAAGFASVDFVDARTGWAVGGSGVVARTDDGGATWTQQPSGSAAQFNDVTFVNKFDGWAIGNTGTILHTTTGGLDPDGAGPLTGWTAEDSGSVSNLHGATFVDATHGWVVGDGGLILHTTTAGEDPDGAGPLTGWTAQPTGGAPMLTDVKATDTQTVWAVGMTAAILRTTTGGEDPDGVGPLSGWTQQDSGLGFDLLCLSMANRSVGAVGGIRGAMASTTNGGATWQTPPFLTNKALLSVDFASSSAGWASGAQGALARTTDGGATWEYRYAGVTADFYGVKALSAADVWIAGSTGTIRHTADGGAHWDTQSVEVGAAFYGIDLTDAANGWVVGEGGTILHTTSGGEDLDGAGPLFGWSWQASGTSSVLLAVDFFDSADGWVVGGGGTILHTTSGGDGPDGGGPLTGWTAQDSGVSVALHDVCFVSASEGWAVGDNGTIVHTTTGGDDPDGAGLLTGWTAQDSGGTQSLYAVAFADAQQGWAVGTNRVLRTNNGGAEWVPVDLGYPIGGLNAVCAVVPVSGAPIFWTVGDTGVVLCTSAFDTTPPVSFVIGRPRTVWINHAVTLHFGATDSGGSGLKTFETNVSAAGWQAGGLLTIAAPTDHSNDGLKPIQYRATDWAGNIEAPKPVSVGIDTRRPTTKALWPANVRHAAYATLKFSVTDARPNAGGAYDKIRIKRLNGTVVKTIDLYGQRVNVWLACRFRCTLARGTYRFSVYATDAAGNTQSRVGANQLTVR